jgi:hypothetical protein
MFGLSTDTSIFGCTGAFSTVTAGAAAVGALGAGAVAGATGGGDAGVAGWEEVGVGFTFGVSDILFFSL